MKSKPNISKKKFKERISEDRAQLETEKKNIVTMRLTREQALSLEPIPKIKLMDDLNSSHEK
jgi:hypothetical protein